MSPKGGKLQQLIDHRVKLTLQDGRTMLGQLLSVDKHMNLVLADCQEFRNIKTKHKAKKEAAVEEESGDGSEPSPKKMRAAKSDEDPLDNLAKRTLGLVILRGEYIVSLTDEAGPPPSASKGRIPASLQVGPGSARPVVRGAPGAIPPGMPQVPGMAPPVAMARGITAPSVPYPQRGAPIRPTN